MHIVRLLLTSLLLSTLLSGCSSLQYYAQLGSGHLQLLQARQSVAQLVDDPRTDPVLKQRLQRSQAARDFASRALALPDNGSYRHYADLRRPFVVWNVFATPALSLTPVTHCFPIAGCVAYRGYYSQGSARAAAAELQLQGMDTFVSGVEAYSTLGWFDDPLLNTMLRRDDQSLAALIFHELAHQQLYVTDDTAFNESFASFVEQQGLRQWRAAQGLPEQAADDAQQRQFIELILAARSRLQALYAGDQPEPAKLVLKRAELARLKDEYRQWRDQQWDGDKRYDAWMAQPLSNAHLLPFALYDQWVPAFATLFVQSGEDWPKFYQAVEALAQLPAQERQRELSGLSPSQP